MRRAVAALALVVASVIAPRAGQGQGGVESVVPPSPVPNGFIHDGGPVLDAAARGRLNARIAEVQRTTGGDVGVAILRDLHDRAPVDVGVAIYRAWKIGTMDSIGSARRDLGALLLIVPKELAPSKRGECWITTGRGAEGTLLDADAGAICRDSVVPHLKNRDYEGAVAAGVGAIEAELQQATANAGAAPPPPTASAAVRRGRDGPRGRGWVVGLLLGTGLIGGGVGGIVYRRRRPRYCPRGHGKMVRLSEAHDDAALDAGQRAEERIGSIDYDVWACPACDERQIIAYGAWRSAYKGCPSCGYRTVRQTARTIVPATRLSGGLEEIELVCQHCNWHDTTRRSTPRLPPPSSSSSGSSFSGGGGSSFGGSGATSGGGGGSSY